MDESWLSIPQKGDVLLMGALFCPPGENIESELEKARNIIGCIDVIHSSGLSGKKQRELASKFIESFQKSNTQFRVIAMPKLKEEFKIYCNNEAWRMKVKAIKLVLSYPYIFENGQEVRLIRPKIMIEHSEDYKTNLETIKSEIESSLLVRQVYQDVETFRIQPIPVVELIGKKVFDSVQLVDLLLGLIRWSISPPKTNTDKFYFFQKHHRCFGITPCYKANRFNTNGKINIWPFRGIEKIFDFN